MTADALAQTLWALGGVIFGWALVQAGFEITHRRRMRRIARAWGECEQAAWAHRTAKFNHRRQPPAPAP